MRIEICCIGNRFNMYRNAIALLYHALVDAGHDVSVEHNRLGGSALAIIVPPMAFRVPELTAELHSGRRRYAVLGIETFTGYSHASRAGSDDDADFRRFLDGAAGVLCLFRDDVARYRPHTRRPVWLRYGVHPALDELADPAERPVDVFFFGDIDPYPERARVIAELRSAGLLVEVLAGASASPPALVRNARIARAKLDLNLAHAEHVSPQRVVYLANNRRCCVSNTVGDADGYLAAAYPQPDTAALVDACRRIVADGSWRRLGEEAYERVRPWSMVDAVTRAVDEMLAD